MHFKQASEDKKRVLILGMGATGCSVARYLSGIGQRFAMADSLLNLPIADELRRDYPGVELTLGQGHDLDFEHFSEVIVSPGVPADLPLVLRAREAGVPLVGDIELFALKARNPVTAITGSNGKSTVAHLLTAMHQQAGQKVALGGNFGIPALDLITQPEVDHYVLELSSFQLETTSSLCPAAAVVLNISEDHMDRYQGLAEYARVKGGIYKDANVVVVNREDPAAYRLAPGDVRCISFGLDESHADDEYGIRESDGEPWLSCGTETLLAASSLRILGRHNWANALAALALGEASGLPREGMLKVLREYTGLPHRSQWVADFNGVTWLNDSKATNPGATLAALKGLDRPVVLIAGGQGKGADFSVLREAIETQAKALILLGEDAQEMASKLSGAAPIVQVGSMAEALAQSASLAAAGDYVLLSPACASFDMFSGYAERGRVFMDLVRELERHV
jgi:UDP-N-acetylmuramoylalanine--D-glutamate ligase